MPKRIKGTLYYSQPEIEVQVKAAIVEILLELQGLVIKKTLEHPKLLHLKCMQK